MSRPIRHLRTWTDTSVFLPRYSKTPSNGMRTWITKRRPGGDASDSKDLDGRSCDIGRRTRIVATIGPSSSDPEIIEQVIAAGVDTFRVNYSHGTLQQKTATIKKIREAEAKAGRYDSGFLLPRRFYISLRRVCTLQINTLYSTRSLTLHDFQADRYSGRPPWS